MAFSPSFSQHKSLVHPESVQTAVSALFTRVYLLGHWKLEQTTSVVSAQTEVTSAAKWFGDGRTVA